LQGIFVPSCELLLFPGEFPELLKALAPQIPYSSEQGILLPQQGNGARSHSGNGTAG
jgi:hypothetical protein